MEDDHVDRPGVEAQQCVKLTGTNSSIGLIVLIDHAHQRALRRDDDAVVLSSRCRILRMLRCGRRAKRLATAFGLYGCLTYATGKQKDVFKDKRGQKPLPASQLFCP